MGNLQENSDSGWNLSGEVYQPYPVIPAGMAGIQLPGMAKPA